MRRSTFCGGATTCKNGLEGVQGEINENAGEAAGLRASSNNGAAGDEYGVTNELPAGMTCPPPAPTGPSSFILHPFNNPSAYFPSFLGGVVWSYVFAACFLGIAIVAARLWGPAVDQQQIVQATALATARTGTAPPVDRPRSAKRSLSGSRDGRGRQSDDRGQDHGNIQLPMGRSMRCRPRGRTGSTRSQVPYHLGAAGDHV